MSPGQVAGMRAALAGFAATMIRPHPSITDPETRWQAQFFNSLLLPLAALTVLGAVFILARTSFTPWAHAISVTLLVSGLIVGRTRHVGLAGILAVSGFAEPCFWYAIERSFLEPRAVGDSMIWLAEAMVFSVLAVSRRRSIIMNAVLFVGMCALAFVLPPHPEMRLAQPLSFLFVFFLLSVMTAVIYQQARQGFFAQMRERERAEQLALRSNETLSAVLASSPAAVIMLDLDSATQLWNPAAEQLFGWSFEEILGKPNPVLAAGQDFQSARPFGMTRQAMPQLVRELEVRTKSGKTVIVNLSTAPLLEPDGAPAGIVGVAVDMSDQKQLEAQLRHAQKMEAVGRLAGGVAHDFNNLLTIINGNAEVLRVELSADKALSPMILEVLDAGNRAVSLTRQLLAFSRKQIVHKERMEMREVVGNMTNMVRRLVGPNIDLDYRDEGEIWAIEADRSQIEQIVLNLVVNAADAMPSGGRLTISCANGRYDPRERLGEASTVIPRAVVLSVSDTGVGMTSDVRERLFEPFFTTKDVGKGTGLGLSTVYGIVANAGAAIEVDSELGAGSTFRIYWPACTAVARSASIPAGELRGNGEMVLVVDDMGSVRALVGRLLERIGYRPLLAGSAEEAMSLSDAHGSELRAAIIDMFMPGIDGPTCSRKLRSLVPGLPVLFMTGQSEQAASLLSDEDASLPLLEKPFGLRQLSQSLNQAMHRRQSTPPT